MIECIELGLSEMSWTLGWNGSEQIGVECVEMTKGGILSVEWNELDGKELFIFLEAYIGMK